MAMTKKKMLRLALPISLLHPDAVWPIVLVYLSSRGSKRSAARHPTCPLLGQGPLGDLRRQPGQPHIDDLLPVGMKTFTLAEHYPQNLCMTDWHAHSGVYSVISQWDSRVPCSGLQQLPLTFDRWTRTPLRVVSHYNQELKQLKQQITLNITIKLQT